MNTLRERAVRELEALQEKGGGPVIPSITLGAALLDMAFNLEPCLAPDDKEVLLLAVDFLLGELKP